MNLRCPICNAMMEPDKVILVGSDVEQDKNFVCVNDECLKVGLVLPSTFRSPAANAMANCIISIGQQIDANHKKLFTKKREGRIQGFQISAKTIAAAMAAIGYVVQIKNG